MMDDLESLIAGYRERWHEESRCAGMDTNLFFPERGRSARHAKAVCRECPVRQECLDWANDTGQRFGIWGGLTDRERVEYRKRQRESA